MGEWNRFIACNHVSNVLKNWSHLSRRVDLCSHCFLDNLLITFNMNPHYPACDVALIITCSLNSNSHGHCFCYQDWSFSVMQKFAMMKFPCQLQITSLAVVPVKDLDPSKLISIDLPTVNFHPINWMVLGWQRVRRKWDGGEEGCGFVVAIRNFHFSQLCFVQYKLSIDFGMLFLKIKALWDF